jgi:hypothetical protein
MDESTRFEDIRPKAIGRDSTAPSVIEIATSVSVVASPDRYFGP